jgi:hypothetical protein
MIEVLVQKAAAHAGLSEAQTTAALSGALYLIEKHGDPAKVSEMFAAIPGSAALAAGGAALTANKGGGLMASLMTKAGGSGGAGLCGAQGQ